MQGHRAFVVALVIAGCTTISPAPTSPAPPPSAAPTAPATPIATPRSTPQATPTTAATPAPTPPEFPLDPTLFETLPLLAEPRFEHTATLLQDGRVLIVGGRFIAFEADHEVVSHVYDSVEVFDPRTRAWSPGPPMERPRARHVAVLLPDGRVLVAGGEQWVDGAAPDSSLEIFDTERSGWTSVDDLPVDPTGAVTLLDGRVLLIGRRDGEANKSYSTTFDPADGRFGSVRRIPGVALDPGAALLPDGRVVVAGSWAGYGDGPPELRDEAAIFDPASGAWSAKQPMLQIRQPSMLVTLPDGRALIVSNASGELFDPATGAWTETEETASARDGTGLVPLPDGRVLAIGSPAGFSDSKPIIEVLDPVTGAWTTYAGFRVLEDLSSTLLSDGSVLIAGGFLECRFGQACEDMRVVADAFLLKTSR